MRNTEKVEKMMCHKIRALSDRSSDQVDGFVDQNDVREHLLQSMQDIAELGTIRNTEKVENMMCSKFSAFSDRSSDRTIGFLDQNYVREHLLQSIQDIVELATIRNTEKVEKMMCHNIRAFSDRSNDDPNGFPDQN
jgi:sensor domain CHASE-containing protein